MPSGWLAEVKACAGIARSKATTPSRQSPATRCMAETYRTLAFLPLVEPGGAGQDGEMKIALLIFDKLAAQDAVGPYEVMRNVPDWEVSFVAKQKGEVRAEGGLGMIADCSIDEVESADIVLVPGGLGSRPLLEDEEVLG